MSSPSPTNSPASTPPSSATDKSELIKRVVTIFVALIVFFGLSIGVIAQLPSPWKTIMFGVAGLITLVVCWGPYKGKTSQGGRLGDAIVGIIVIAICASVPVAIYYIATHRENQAGSQNRQQVGSIKEVPTFAYAGRGYTPIQVPGGMTLIWVINHPTEHILYHFNNELPDKEDWRDQEIRTGPRAGPYTAYVRAKGVVDVPITVYLRPVE